MARRRIIRRRKRRPRQRNRRPVRTIPPDNVTKGRIRISPVSTITFGTAQLHIKPPFRILSVDLMFSAVDTATANKQTIGSTLLQVRQVGYISSSDGGTPKATDGEVIKVGGPYMATMATVKRVRFKPRGIVYPQHYDGTALIAIDCLCFAAGSEIGADMHYVIRVQTLPTFESEACKVLELSPVAYNPSKSAFTHDFDDELSCSTEVLSMPSPQQMRD